MYFSVIIRIYINVQNKSSKKSKGSHTSWNFWNIFDLIPLLESPGIVLQRVLVFQYTHGKPLDWFEKGIHHIHFENFGLSGWELGSEKFHA